MASEDEKDTTLYCICRQPYDETEFMIECDVCKDWFHGSCVGVQEHLASDIEIYHCPNCQVLRGPLVLKKRKNWHRHDYSESDGSAKAVQTGTVVFIKELKGRHFPSADEIPLLRVSGHVLTKRYFDENGMQKPILVEKKDGLDLTVPPSNFTIQDVENYVGSMREIDVIDVSKQEDYKMLMREWTDYYNSPNRDKIFNVISLEFSNTKLSDLVVVPSVVREISWVCNGVWPDSLPEDCPYSRPEVQKYCLMGVRDSFTDFHIDFGGTSVWYHVLRGEKVFYLIEPTSANLTLYENWLNASNQSEMFFGDQVDKCYKCVVKQGQTFFIPTGWIHAVFTPIDSLVFGGNFLHSYNIPVQLEAYAIEKRVKTPEKYLFPCYETINWYAAKHVLDTLKDYIEDGKKPPPYIVEGGKALAYHLKSWTQRKDFVKTAKHEVPEHIQYGRLLKELNKEVKVTEEMTKSTPVKGRGERKRKKKNSLPPPKQMQNIDLLHQHTQQKLQQMEMEQKKNIYNFQDDEEEEDATPSKLLKVRIPKAGAYFDPNQKQETDGDDPESPDKKGSLKLKVSNGKIVSERKKGKQGKGFQPLVSSDHDDSDHEALVVDENPKPKRSKAAKNLATGSTKPSLKLKLSVSSKPSTESPALTSVPRLPSSVVPATNAPIKSEFIKSETATSSLIGSASIPPLGFSQIGGQSKLSAKIPALSNLSPSQLAALRDKMAKGDITLSQLQSAMTKAEETLSQGEEGLNPGETLTVEQALRMNIPTIRGGLNGSIADILEASGYGTETAFTVDDEIGRAPSPSMREAIQGMLSMSRMGGMQLFSRAESRRQALKFRGQHATEDEEEKLSKCYQDEEYVYPTLEMEEDEAEQLLKARGKPNKDETWNPKARVNISVPLGERPHRDGARRESIENSLAASAAKIASAPKVKRQYKKKPKLDLQNFEPQAGTSGTCLSPTHSGSAFRPGVKAPVSGAPDSPTKAKKPKKGQATAKQRLGKILKIHKMGIF